MAARDQWDSFLLDIDIRDSQRLAAAACPQVWPSDQGSSLRDGSAIQPEPTIRWQILHHQRTAPVGEFLLRREGNIVRIPRVRESSHFMMIGDTGSGKSSLIRQMLLQVEGRGETAIVYDPALEYTPQFYEPGRGDVILNAVDARMPYWSPCDEVEHEAEAEGLAAALFKDDPRTNPFFVMVPRQIFATC